MGSAVDAIMLLCDLNMASTRAGSPVFMVPFNWQLMQGETSFTLPEQSRAESLSANENQAPGVCFFLRIQCCRSR